MAHDFDVLILGAGLSGIGAAHHLQDELPSKTYAILEARDAIGGTWDLFRYPGIRSDSDMHTLGYRFRPWVADKAIADGSAILEYVKDTAREAGIDRHIRFGHKVVRAEWSSDDARWTVTCRLRDGSATTLTCGFLLGCGGYYDYDRGYMPEFPGSDRFGGPIIHPQHWPEDLDYRGKRVVVIGSGATAVTLVPAMTDKAAHVTMLQRSPTYIISMPSEDPINKVLRRVLPTKLAYALTRWKNVLLQYASYQLARRRPRVVKGALRKMTARHLPEGFDMTHFKPKYQPWDQRLCLIPDGDLFRVLNEGTASIVTDHIETFTETGIRLGSGTELEADIIVTATGLNLKPMGGVELVVDGEPVDVPSTIAYKAMMLGGVPNMAFTVGYTNASWTLKADLTAEYVCRLLAHMDRHGHATCVPEPDPTIEPMPFLDFQSGYVQRSLHLFPKQGTVAPWRLQQNYPADIITLRHRPIDDGTLRFASPAARSRETEAVAA